MKIEKNPTKEELVGWLYDSDWNVKCVTCETNGTDYYDKFTKKQLDGWCYDDLYEQCVRERII